MRPPLTFVGGLLAVGFGVFLLLLLARQWWGGTIAGSAKRVARFTTQLFVALQVVVSMRGAQPGLPPALQEMYNALGALQFQGVSVPPACFNLASGGPYMAQVAQFAVVMLLLVMATVLNGPLLLEWWRERDVVRGSLWDDMCGSWCWCSSRCPCCRQRPQTAAAKVAPAPPPPAPAPPPAADDGGDDRPSLSSPAAARYKARGPASTIRGRGPAHRRGWWSRTGLRLSRRITFTLLSLLWATVLNTVISTLRCVDVRMDVATYIRMDADGTSLRRAGITATIAELQACDGFPFAPACRDKLPHLAEEIRVPVVASNPVLVCYESGHTTAAALAWLLVVFYLTGFPIATCLLYHGRVRWHLAYTGQRSKFQRAAAAEAALRASFIHDTAMGVAAPQPATCRGRCAVSGRAAVAIACWPRIRALAVRRALAHAAAERAAAPRPAAATPHTGGAVAEGASMATLSGVLTGAGAVASLLPRSGVLADYGDDGTLLSVDRGGRGTRPSLLMALDFSPTLTSRRDAPLTAGGDLMAEAASPRFVARRRGEAATPAAEPSPADAPAAFAGEGEAGGVPGAIDVADDRDEGAAPVMRMARPQGVTMTLSSARVGPGGDHSSARGRAPRLPPLPSVPAPAAAPAPDVAGATDKKLAGAAATDEAPASRRRRSSASSAHASASSHFAGDTLGPQQSAAGTWATAVPAAATAAPTSTPLDAAAVALAPPPKPDMLRPLQPPAQEPSTMLDDLPSLDRDPLLRAIYTNTPYRPSRLIFMQVDIGLLAIVTVALSLWGEPTTTAGAVGQFCIVVGALAATLVASVIWTPQRGDERFSTAIDFYILVLAMIQALVNCLNLLVRIRFNLLGAPDASGGGDGGDAGGVNEYGFTIDTLPPSPLRTGFIAAAFVALVASIILFLLIAVAFLLTVRNGSIEEQVMIEADLERRHSSVVGGEGAAAASAAVAALHSEK